jgi:hypothetical protein
MVEVAVHRAAGQEEGHGNAGLAWRLPLQSRG